MKHVILKSLEMVNFKGEKNRKTTFDAVETSIIGKNGIGKSRHFDAFTWLLFGKDVLDRKDFEVKTRLANGDELHKVDCYVEGVLSVDGEDIILRRALCEEWVKPRGQQEQVFKGNKTECAWNNAPVTVTEFTRRVKDIIDANVFKMITNPTFFANMDWKLQREQLFQLAGTITDAEIAQGNSQYEQLLDRLSKKSFDDFKREQNATKKRLKGELDEVQPRIEQTQKMMPEQDDFDRLKKEVEYIDEQIAAIDRQIASVVEANKARYADEQAKQSRIYTLQNECNELVAKVESEARQRATQQSFKRDELLSQQSSLRTLYKSNKAQLNTLRIQLAQEHQKSASATNATQDMQAQQEKLRQEWYEVNASSYSGETTCPHCHQPLPEDMIHEAQDLFKTNKAARLIEITSKGQGLTNDIAAKNDEIAQHAKTAQDIEASIAELEKTIAEQSHTIHDMDATINAFHIADVQTIKNEEIDGWRERQEEIQHIRATMTNDITDDTTKDLQKKKREWNVKRDEFSRRIVNEKIIAKCTDEIASLEARGRELAQQIADIERDEYIMQAFTRAKIDECEKRINSLFDIVKFRLYDYTLDGNAIETCVATIDGVPYGSANTASRLNAGLDIINTLCRFYGITAPIFLDNRESTLTILDVHSQIINLVVTDDDELTVINGKYNQSLII